MAVNKIGDFIKSVFSTLVNKNGAVFQALFANPSGDGTVETIFNELESERKVWEVNGSSIYNQTGEQLNKTLHLLSVITRLNSDTDETILNRIKLIFYRNGATLWGDKWNVIDIFKTFFNTKNVYIVNNTESFDDNLLVNGDFEKTDGWTLDGCCYDTEARFEDNYGILFNAAGSCTQTVSVDSDSVYFVHFFLKGNVRLQITDNTGRFWNPTKDEFGSWSDEESIVSYQSTNWDNKSIFFITDDKVTGVTIKFLYTDKYYGFLDFVRLNKKTGASTFSLVVVLDGSASDEDTGLAPGENDPVESVDYSKVSYYDKTFMFNGKGINRIDLYKEIMNIVNAAGISATIELLTREDNV